MNADQITERLREFESLCRKAGMPVTVQRRAVLQAVLERDDHPTADEVLAIVKNRLPEISRTTVYRVLDTLVDMGMARRLQHPGSSARFDGKIHRHHHLICRKCHKVVDLDDAELDNLSVDHVAPKGFEVEDFSVHVLGICNACRRAAAKKPETDPS